MKIIVSSQALTPWYGGSAISEASLCAQLAKSHDVTVLCRKGALDYSFVRSFGVKEVREFLPQDVFDAWKSDTHWLAKLFDGTSIFHLNGHWKWENYFFARLCTRKHIPYVLHPRGMLLVGHRKTQVKRVFNLMIGKWVVKHAARVIALSHFEVKQFAPYAIEPRRLVVLPNGISLPELAGASNFPTELKGIDQPFFLYLGRLEQRKNLLFLVEAMAKYRRAGGKAVLLLVGPVERDYDKQINAKATALGIGDSVRVLSPAYGQEKWIYMAKSLAVIYPSFDEPFGRVPFEAIATKAYPIVPNESGSAEYLGAIIPEAIYRHQNLDSLVDVMRVIEKKRETGDTQSLTAAQTWVREELDWDRIGEKIVRMYTEIVAENRARHPGKTSLAAS